MVVNKRWQQHLSQNNKKFGKIQYKFRQYIKFWQILAKYPSKIINHNILHTPSNVSVMARKTFSHTPDEAMSVGLAKACDLRENLSCWRENQLFHWKSNRMRNLHAYTLCLCLAHPTGGFLMVGDGVFSIDGITFGFSTFSNPSSQSEELHQQYISPHLLQNSQYLPRNLLLPACSSSSSVWGTAAAYLGSVKTWGRYLTPWPTGTSVSVFVLSSAWMPPISLWGVLLFLVLTLLLLSAFFPSMILFCSSVGVLEHTELSSLGLDLYLYF